MLKLNQEQTLNQLAICVYEVFENDTSGHGIDHIKRVVSNTTLLLSYVPEANPFVTLSIAYLHDVFDHKINPVDDVEVALLDYMASLNLDFEGFEKEIALGASQIGYSKRGTVGVKSIESTIVSEADYLDAMGPFGVIRTIQYGLLHDHSVEEMMNHLPEKLLKLKDLMKTPGAIVMAKSRHEILQNFYDAYLQDKEY